MIVSHRFSFPLLLPFLWWLPKRIVIPKACIPGPLVISSYPFCNNIIALTCPLLPLRRWFLGWIDISGLSGELPTLSGHGYSSSILDWLWAEQNLSVSSKHFLPVFLLDQLWLLSPLHIWSLNSIDFNSWTHSLLSIFPVLLQFTHNNFFFLRFIHLLFTYFERKHMALF